MISSSISQAKESTLVNRASETTIAAVRDALVTPAGRTLKTMAFNLTATGTVVPAVVGKRIKVYAVVRSFTNTVGCNFRSGALTALEGSIKGLANTTYPESILPPAFLFATAAGQSLDLVLTGSGVNGRVSYWDEDIT